jgi:hypothetical protein
VVVTEPGRQVGNGPCAVHLKRARTRCPNRIQVARPIEASNHIPNPTRREETAPSIPEGGLRNDVPDRSASTHLQPVTGGPHGEEARPIRNPRAMTTMIVRRPPARIAHRSPWTLRPRSPIAGFPYLRPRSSG